ncbi:hypothetical protein AwWohl_12310 [Gammaproteobacteria bacterium]|nr:hypothetical protein AwWohl_12310 [Gammaproteobacteria bacterium]
MWKITMKKILLLISIAVGSLVYANPVLINKIAEPTLTELKIMTYNIAAGANNFKVDLALTAATIKELSPDIIALQEVDRNTKRSGNLDQAEILSKLTGYNVIFGKAIDFDGGEYGIAVLSKHPIKHLDTQKLPSGDEELRIALYTEVIIEGYPSPITFINTHLDWHENPAIRLAQVYAINEKSLDIRDIKILAGDFNDVDLSDTHAQLRRYWDSVFPIGMNHRTWPADNPEIGIDYIYTNKAQIWQAITTVPNQPLTNNDIQWNKVSDHLPVITILKLIEQ